MPPHASVRDLRNRFPKIRRIVETEGEVLLTERGEARYRLTLHRAAPGRRPRPVDYWRRLQSLGLTPLTAAQARELEEASRGDR